MQERMCFGRQQSPAEEAPPKSQEQKESHCRLVVWSISYHSFPLYLCTRPADYIHPPTTTHIKSIEACSSSSIYLQRHLLLRPLQQRLAPRHRRLERPRVRRQPPPPNTPPAPRRAQHPQPNPTTPTTPTTTTAIPHRPLPPAFQAQEAPAEGAVHVLLEPHHKPPQLVDVRHGLDPLAPPDPCLVDAPGAAVPREAEGGEEEEEGGGG